MYRSLTALVITAVFVCSLPAQQTPGQPDFPGTFSILGYDPAGLVGRSVADYVVLKETAERAMSRKLAPGAVLLPYTRTFRKSDRSEVTLLLIDRHLKDKEGHVTGIRTAFAEAPALA